MGIVGGGVVNSVNYTEDRDFLSVDLDGVPVPHCERDMLVSKMYAKGKRSNWDDFFLVFTSVRRTLTPLAEGFLFCISQKSEERVLPPSESCGLVVNHHWARLRA